MLVKWKIYMPNFIMTRKNMAFETVQFLLCWNDFFSPFLFFIDCFRYPAVKIFFPVAKLTYPQVTTMIKKTRSSQKTYIMNTTRPLNDIFQRPSATKKKENERNVLIQFFFINWQKSINVTVRLKVSVTYVFISIYHISAMLTIAFVIN